MSDEELFTPVDELDAQIRPIIELRPDSDQLGQ
jgi:hypothetical protein